ncbi:inositol monophosphatase [Rubrivivax sp. JA1026]|uniref:inositol monophosphatase family protein n=1 Tax=Rubrivivax sp. JA1026 TaxID=2710888 RepID=UPI0013E98E38|nr:inositol monophosphatase [Rubrivivax sp. JA1026]
MIDDIALATAAARTGGEYLTSRLGKANLTRWVERDVKLAEDAQAEALIVGHLTRHSRHPILTEEAGWIGEPARGDAAYWVVDPLDGSFNFLHGIPLCAVSVALCRGLQPVLGCVHDFIHGETCAGGPGLGLRVNGQAAAADAHRGGILGTGIPAAAGDRPPSLAQALAHWRKVRMLGTAALSLAWVAQGRLGGYEESGIRWWDVAGGLALVAGAGGRFEVGPAAGRDASDGLDPVDPLHVRAWSAPATGISSY